MAEIEIREMDEATEYFVATCSHVNESEETDAAGRRRLAWLREMKANGLRVKAALIGGRTVGFAYSMPIELSPWGPVGEGLTVMPCVWVLPAEKGQGAGTALISAVEDLARREGGKALVTFAYHIEDFWFMPAPFFEKLGFTEVARKGNVAIVWKVFDDAAVAPTFTKPNYSFEPAEGKVTVNLFYNTFCLTSDIEAQRVREVAAEFGDRVSLREYSADDPAVLARTGMSRAIFVNGKEIGWGYEAPKEGIREAIEKAMKDI